MAIALRDFGLSLAAKGCFGHREAGAETAIIERRQVVAWKVPATAGSPNDRSESGVCKGIPVFSRAIAAEKMPRIKTHKEGD